MFAIMIVHALKIDKNFISLDQLNSFLPIVWTNHLDQQFY